MLGYVVEGEELNVGVFLSIVLLSLVLVLLVFMFPDYSYANIGKKFNTDWEVNKVEMEYLFRT